MTTIDASVLLLKASVLLGGALLVAAFLRRGSAVGRHRAWSALFASLVALPLLALTIPTIEVRIPAWRRTTAPPSIDRGSSKNVHETPTTEVNGVVTQAQPSQVTTTSSVFVAPDTRLSPSTIVLVVWIGGMCVAFGALLISLVRVARLTASGTVIDDADWREARERISRQLSLGRPARIIASPRVSTPMAGGVIRPTVFVPMDATTWSAEQREIVLAHEIAHLASRDPLRHLLCRIAFSIYWFHPLVWVAVRSAVNACEQACDEIVLALGVRPSTYARVLLDFAENAPAAVPAVALPIVRPALLETRLMAILNSHRPSIGTRGVIPGGAVVALTLSIAAVQPSPVTDAVAPKPPIARPSVGMVAPPKAKAAQPAATVSHYVPSAPMTIVQSAGAVEATCRLDATNSRYFDGTISSSGTTIYQQIGTRGDDHIIQSTFGDLHVCAVAEGHGRDRDDSPSHWPDHATRVILETQQPGDVRRMEVVDNRVTWTVNGRSQVADPAAIAWRDRLMDLLDATWDLSMLKGRVSTLRGQISTTYGERSTLQGEISTLRGRVSTLQGQISTVRGEESTLRGQISTIRGQLSTLRGQISTEQGQISSLQGTRSDRYVDRDGIDASIRKHEARIRDIEDEIRSYDVETRVADVQRRIDVLDTEGRVRAIQRQLQDFDVDGRVAEVNKRLAALDVEGQVEGINREIRALDADNRGVILQARRDEALARLKAVLGH